MAKMIPAHLRSEDFNSPGEMLLYEKLEKLPPQYTVFYSIHWSDKKRNHQSSRSSHVVWGEADFTVFHPEYGLVVIEAKDGLIHVNGNREWVQENRNTGAQKIISPIEQAEKSKYKFIELFRAAFGGDCPWYCCSAVWFTTASRRDIAGDLPPAYQEAFTLWQTDYGTAEKTENALRRVYSYYNVRKANPTEAMVRKAINVLAPQFGVFESVKGRAEMAEVLFQRMTREQAYLLDYLEEQQEAAIHGVAGTGKTMLAIEKAKRLSESDRVLFLCFNRFLKNRLSSSYANPNLDFYNLDGLFVKCTGNIFPPDQSEKEEMLLQFLENWDSYRELDYKHIIVDEGQDFLEEHLVALQQIATNQKGCFYVFFDKNQFVQGREYAHWLDSLECRLVLSRNCRNTKEIALTSTRPIDIEESKIKLRYDGDFGTATQPNIFLSKDKNELKERLEKLVSKYLKAGIPKEEIVVLSCKASGQSLLKEEDFTLSQSVHLATEGGEGDILFTTVRKYKGLEATVIICVDVDKFVFETNAKAFYVGASRATTFLEIITTDSVENLTEALTGHAVKGPNGRNALSKALRVKIGTSRDLQ